MKHNKEWKKVGVIGVDAGLCWVGDPCYCVTPDATNHPAKTWKEFCNKLFKSKTYKNLYTQWDYAKGHPGLGVTVDTGYGDGEYNVYVKKNYEGRIAEVKVVFINENENEDEEN